jgi:di/tricarboxylate transporter
MYPIMKSKIVVFFSMVFLLAGINSSRAMINASAVVPISNANETWVGIVLGLVILVLMLLVLWLIKNSNRLKDDVDSPESNTGEWLNKHVNDLESDQLEILISRVNKQQQEEYNNLNPNH